jgi:hypothetical protein
VRRQPQDSVVGHLSPRQSFRPHGTGHTSSHNTALITARSPTTARRSPSQDLGATPCSPQFPVAAFSPATKSLGCLALSLHPRHNGLHTRHASRHARQACQAACQADARPADCPATQDAVPLGLAREAAPRGNRIHHDFSQAATPVGRHPSPACLRDSGPARPTWGTDASAAGGGVVLRRCGSCRALVAAAMSALHCPRVT